MARGSCRGSRRVSFTMLLTMRPDPIAAEMKGEAADLSNYDCACVPRRAIAQPKVRGPRCVKTCMTSRAGREARRAGRDFHIIAAVANSSERFSEGAELRCVDRDPHRRRAQMDGCNASSSTGRGDRQADAQESYRAAEDGRCASANNLGFTTWRRPRTQPLTRSVKAHVPRSDARQQDEIRHVLRATNEHQKQKRFTAGPIQRQYPWGALRLPW